MANKRGRGRPPIAESIVEKLEATGDQPLADKVRAITNLPPRPLTRDEDFIDTVRKQVGMYPVGFHATSDDEAEHWATLVRELPAEPNMAYKAKVVGVRIEVRLVSASE